MDTASPVLQEKNTRWQWLLIAFIIVISTSCVFISAQIALLSAPEKVINANMLPESSVSYHLDASEQIAFAPQDAGIIIQITRDAQSLAFTPAPPSESSTPLVVAQIAENPTRQPTNTQVPPTVTERPSASDTPEPPKPPTKTQLPPTPTSSATSPPPSPTAIPPSATATPRPPTMTAIPTTQKPKNPTDTPVPPADTNTPLPTLSATLEPTQTPSATSTPLPSATNSPTVTSSITPTPSDTPLPSNTPLPTNTPGYKPIKPDVDCVNHNGDGTVTAYFGYKNKNSYDVSIPVGSNNRFFPAPQDRGQPETFTPGNHAAAFRVTFDENIVGLFWSVDGNITAAWVGSPPCD